MFSGLRWLDGRRSTPTTPEGAAETRRVRRSSKKDCGMNVMLTASDLVFSVCTDQHWGMAFRRDYVPMEVRTEEADMPDSVYRVTEVGSAPRRGKQQPEAP